MASILERTINFGPHDRDPLIWFLSAFWIEATTYCNKITIARLPWVTVVVVYYSGCHDCDLMLHYNICPPKATSTAILVYPSRCHY
jgi:hypothetical protein